MNKKGFIVLEDGTVYEGQSFGFSGEQIGEIVFNTGMTGYQEILTDPSYKGQIVVMTYPLIGNYGINSIDTESAKPQVSGFIVKENSNISSNWRAQSSLTSYLIEHRIIGIEGVDTRAITRHIRVRGAMKAIISTTTDDITALLSKVQTAPGIVGQDLVQLVTCKEPYVFNEKTDSENSLDWYEYLPEEHLEPSSENDQTSQNNSLNNAMNNSLNNAMNNSLNNAMNNSMNNPRNNSSEQARYRIVAMDFGVKKNILQQLTSLGFEVSVVPSHYSTQEIMSRKPHGLFLSNGPGDPAAVPYVVETVKKLLGRLPIFGICLGHQILGLALGGKTFKLKFGHRGCNHPVKDLTTGKVEITSQNHGFCVDIDSLKSHEVTITHLNLNDQTLEGMQHNRWPLFSVQYHPEGSPGPHDANYLFKRFFDLIRQHAQKESI